MNLDEWPVAIDGHEYWPVPVAWLEHGIDASAAALGPRVYAVSVASVDVPRALRVRYATARSAKVVERDVTALVAQDGEAAIDDLLPGEIRQGTWQRSFVPSETLPTDAARAPEMEVLIDRWGDRRGDVPSRREVTERLATDGGPGVLR